MSSFIPRILYIEDIWSISPSSTEIQLKPLIMKYYNLRDICAYRNNFYYITAINHATDTLTVENVTSKVTLNWDNSFEDVES